METEKFFPISINPQLCIRCQRCMYSCHPKAIFFKNTLRYVDYNKCEGCLKCVDVCEQGAIEVISIKEGKLITFNVDSSKCNLCGMCLKEDFCFQNLFEISQNNQHKEIQFNKKDMERCFNCLKCFKSCPCNAILPEIE